LKSSHSLKLFLGKLQKCDSSCFDRGKTERRDFLNQIFSSDRGTSWNFPMAGAFTSPRKMRRDEVEYSEDIQYSKHRTISNIQQVSSHKRLKVSEAP